MKRLRIQSFGPIAGLLILGGCGDSTDSVADGPGKETYEANCQACHGPGQVGAPKFGNSEDWAPRIERGKEALYTNALEGTGKMPPRGANADLSDKQVREAVDYMVNNSQP